jgi:hypothetical protein
MTFLVLDIITMLVYFLDILMKLNYILWMNDFDCVDNSTLS